MTLKKRTTALGIAAVLLSASATPVWADPASEAAVVRGAGTSGSAAGATPMTDAVKGSATEPMPVSRSDSDPATANVSKDKAVELARQYASVPDDYALQYVNFSSNPYDRTSSGGGVWNLSFAKRVQDRYYGEMSVAIDAGDGKLLSFYSYANDPDRKPSYPPKVDRVEAQNIAEAFIQKLNLPESAHVRYNTDNDSAYRPPLVGEVRYEFRYDHYVGDIPYPQNFISVTVDGEGNVVGYRLNWDDTVTFEPAQSVISAEQAAEAFRKLAVPTLSYLFPYRQSGEKKPYVAYEMDTFRIDAITGTEWTPDGSPAPDRKPGEPLTKEPLAPMPSSNRNLTRDQAIEAVKSLVTLPEDAVLEDVSYSENTPADYGKTTSTWNLRWTYPIADEDRKGTIYATVSAATGQLIQYSKNEYVPILLDAKPETEADGKLSFDEAKAKAVEFVKKALPYYTHQLAPDRQESIAVPFDKTDSMPTFSFRFARWIDGVRAAYENVYVNVDRKTGEIIGFSANLSMYDYPEQKPEVIDVEKAKELLLSQYHVRLTYEWVPTAQDLGPIPIEKYNLMVASGEIPPYQTDQTGNAKKEAQLVYRLVPKYTGESAFLDAVTGEWRSRETGEPVTLGKVAATDIEGHWAERELQLMIDYKALDIKDGKVYPDEAITKGEMIKMLVIAVNGGYYMPYVAENRAASFDDVSKQSPYFAYVEQAVDLRLIDRNSRTFEPNAKMTREEMAQLIVRALGYSKLAQYGDMFAAAVSDASELTNKGDVAIVLGLGIMTSTDGKFMPKQEVTRAQAATAFYRYLQKRSELQETPRF
jgi:hypothetical protein